jgi:hypothetical protein
MKGGRLLSPLEEFMPHSFGNTGTDDGVTGSSTTGRGVVGESVGQAGVVGSSTNFVGVWGASQSPATAGQPGVFGTSANWEGVHGETNSTVAAGVAGIQLNPNGTGTGVFGQSNGKGAGVFGTSVNSDGVTGSSTTGRGVVGESVAQAGVVGSSTNFVGVWGASQSPATAGHPGVFGTSANWEGVHGETNSTIAAGVAGIQLNPNGTGAGIYGESRGKGPAGFFKGDVQVTGDVILTNQDCAEDFDIGLCTNVEPGTVMALDEQGLLQESRQPYDKKVAGVISGAGTFKPGLILGRKEEQGDSHRATVALIGKVYCKVDAQFGEISVGDLLTSSSTPGHAMKADDPLKAFGCVIGKALQNMSAGEKGLIPILVALQ